MSAPPPTATHRLRRCDLPLPLLSEFFTLSLCLMVCSSSGVTCRKCGGVGAWCEGNQGSGRCYRDDTTGIPCMQMSRCVAATLSMTDWIKMPGARQLPTASCGWCCRVLAHQLLP
jgi:hypothetical protein